nr:DNA oxidative demethylase ALKBH2-like isoform X2 [Solanum lycopersicum]
MIRVFGRSCVQPRGTCYVASEGLPQLVYSGYQPHAYSWDEFPPLKDILMLSIKLFQEVVSTAYKQKLLWTNSINCFSFLGCEREFLLK